MDTVDAGRKGGKRTLYNYGRDHMRDIGARGAAKRKPDNQVKPNSLYMRDYRAKLRKRTKTK